MTDDQMYLADIFERIERIESYTQGGREVFLQSQAVPTGSRVCHHLSYLSAQIKVADAVSGKTVG